MSKAVESCKIISDADNIIASWVFKSLDEPLEGLGENLTIGVACAGKMIAGIVFNDLTPQRNVWLSIYSNSKRWCNRRVLKFVFELAFDVMKVARVSVMIDEENVASRDMVERLGFVREGTLRQFENNGHDGIVYGMLKAECKWRDMKNGKKQKG